MVCKLPLLTVSLVLLALTFMIGSCQATNTNESREIPPTTNLTPTVTLTPNPIFLYHRVERGDTLWKIARKYGVDVEILADVNELDDPAAIQVGQEILVSERVTISGRYLPTATPTTTPTPTPRPCTQGCQYVHPGCDIKGFEARIDGERMFLLPEDELYRRRQADLWFCNEEDAKNAGWRRWTDFGPATIVNPTATPS